MLPNDVGHRKQVLLKGTTNSTKMVAFLGLFNCTRYRLQILSWLPSLDLTGFELIVCDNSSSDKSLEWFCEEVVPLLSVPVTLIRNGNNLGGYGSLIGNLDYLQHYEWVMTLHQDDMYRSDHAQLHRAAADTATGEIGAIFSEAISKRSLDGGEVAFPRAAWLYGKSSRPEQIFLDTIRGHFLPFSGATFRLRMLLKIHIPWHNAAFPDSELVLQALPEWKYLYLRDPSVTYLENPLSESHSLAEPEKVFGIAASLLRVFSGANFAKLVKDLSESELTEFATKLMTVISSRFHDESLSRLLIIVFSEAIFEACGGSGPSLDVLIRAYQHFGRTNTGSLLSNLKGQVIETDIGLETSTEISGVQKSERRNSMKVSKIFFLLILRLLPRDKRPEIFRRVMGLGFMKKRFPLWDYNSL